MTDIRGWLTLQEVLEAGLKYDQILDLVERGKLHVHLSGRAELYNPDDVRREAGSQGG